MPSAFRSFLEQDRKIRRQYLIVQSDITHDIASIDVDPIEAPQPSNVSAEPLTERDVAKFIDALRKLLPIEVPQIRNPSLHVSADFKHDPCRSELARKLTQEFVAGNFGEVAAQASLFIYGIAGLAAAQSGIGPTLQEANDWVHDELVDGRPVSIIANSLAIGTGFPATSFIAYLVGRYGSASLPIYLQAFDPERHDGAAYAAFHQPLAIIEEEWIATLRKRATDREVFRSFFRKVLPLLKPYKWKQFEILVYLLLAAAFNVAQPYSIKIIIDRLTYQVRTNPAGANTGTVFVVSLLPLLVLLLALYILDGAVSLRRTFTVNWLNQNILNGLQIKMYAHLQRLPHSFYGRAKIGDIMSRLNSDLDNVQSALSQVTNKALYQSFKIVGAVTALVILTRKSPELAIPILLIIPLFAVSYYALRSRNKQASREQRQRVGQTMAAVQEHFSAHAVIKAFGLEERFSSDYTRRLLSLQKSKLRLAMLGAFTDLTEDMTTGLAQLLVFGIGGYLVLRDGGRGLGVGDLAALLVLVKSVFGPIASLSGIGQTMQQATGSLERVFELFDEPVTIADNPDATALISPTKSIRFDNVTFSYGGDRAVLSSLTLTIPVGHHVAIVGSSGSGKSTIVNLLLRFWDPGSGRVVFDESDIRDFTIASLRGEIGLVFQETFIFNTTLRANIALGRSDATDSEIVSAAKAALIDDFIQSLPAGYDTVPGENGAQLSVGQKQRIAIARTFLRNPRILILDEATSALDAQTEAGVLATLSELSQGRTTISVTHRISQAAVADQIFVLDGGKLVETGVHADLLGAGGLYQRLYEQATGC